MKLSFGICYYRTGSILTYPKFCCPKNGMFSYLWLWSQKLDHCFQLLKDTLVPCDCLIINGSAIVNEATLTGGNVYRINFATGEWRFRCGVFLEQDPTGFSIKKGNVASKMTLFQDTVLEVGHYFLRFTQRKFVWAS